MAGAYTALPPEDLTPDVPDDWDIHWTFPGPAPPGYEFDYGLNIDAPSFVVPGSSTSGTVTLTDHDDYVTSTPDGGSTIEVSAKFTDTQEEVPITGTTLYPYSSLEDDFSGAEFSFTLGVTAGDNGRMVTITAASTPFSGYDVSATTNITVTVITDLRATLTAAWSNGTPTGELWTATFNFWVTLIFPGIGNNETAYLLTSLYWNGGGYYDKQEQDLENDTITIDCDGFDDYSATCNISASHNFIVKYDNTPVLIPQSLAMTLKVYNGDTLLSTYEMSTDEYDYHINVWYVNASNGNVTVY